jgi:hypothetical protein
VREDVGVLSLVSSALMASIASLALSASLLMVFDMLTPISEVECHELRRLPSVFMKLIDIVGEALP